jgi:hypothetical protein
MDLMLLDRIITEAEDLGIHMFIFSGGNAGSKDGSHHSLQQARGFNLSGVYQRNADRQAICRRHESGAELHSRNQRRGFREANDSRRGEGTYERVDRRHEAAQEGTPAICISTCYTSKNVDEVGSDAFLDAMIENGAKFCWYFTYMPIGNGAPTDLMASDEQRAFMYRQVRRFRKEKPMFIIDFWNDGEFVAAALRCGRSYIPSTQTGTLSPARLSTTRTSTSATCLIGSAQVPVVSGIPQRAAIQREPASTLPAARQPGKARQNGEGIRRSFNGYGKPGERRRADREVPGHSRSLGGYIEADLEHPPRAGMRQLQRLRI